MGDAHDAPKLEPPREPGSAMPRGHVD